MRRAFDLDGLAAVQLLLRLGSLAVDADLAVFDQQLHAGAADVGDRLGKILVEPQSGGRGIGGEGANAVFGSRPRYRAREQAAARLLRRRAWRGTRP